MKTRLALLLSAILAGCGGIYTAPAQMFRPTGISSAIPITGTMEQSDPFGTSHSILIQIGGTPVLSGPIGSGTGDVSGTYNGRPALALCNRADASGGSYAVHCRIVIDGEFAATLSFF